jgi:hypothetical protein
MSGWRAARRGGILASALVVAVCAAAPAYVQAQGPDEARGGKGLNAYPSCKRGGAKPSRFCFEGDRPVAVLRAFKRARVAYRVCIRGRKGGPKCERKRTHRKGSRSRVPFAIRGDGKYRIVWFVKGRQVERDTLVIRNRAVFHVGDSLGVGTAPYLPNALSDWDVDQSVKVARHAPEAIAILRQRGGLPGVIVVGVGGNDDPNNVSAFRDAVNDARQIAGPNRCVVWPNHYSSKPVAGTTFDGYNAVLEDFERRHRNFRIVNWAAIARSHPGWLAGDGIHVNATGYQARARAIAKQVRRC